jgi:hypothetical protein
MMHSKKRNRLAEAKLTLMNMINVSDKKDKISRNFKNLVFVELLISFIPRNKPMNWLVYNVMKYHGMVGFSLYKACSVLLNSGDKYIALG